MEQHLHVGVKFHANIKSWWTHCTNELANKHIKAMFPSSGHFKSLHCPFHLEGECGRIYCHYRHAKSADERAGENNSILSLEEQIQKELNLEKDEFDAVINEEKDDVHEKLLNRKLKTLFPSCDTLLDNLRLPEPSFKDNWDLSVDDGPTDAGEDDLKNLTEPPFEGDDVDDTPLDEGPLKQFLEEDAKRKSDSEQNNPNTLQKRHIIISCLEKIEKRSEFHPRRVGTIRPKSFASVENVNTELVKEAPPEADYNSVKQEEPDSDNSSDEDAAEVDSLLTQISLLNPQLFSGGEKNDESEKDSNDFERTDSKYNLHNGNFSSQMPDPSELPTQPYPGSDVSDLCTQPYPRSEPHTSSTSTNSSFSSHRVKQRSVNNRDSPRVRVKQEKTFDDDECTQVFAPPITPISSSTIAEQNRVKNLFKNTFCSNIDQFFDLSDACRVYGTEIFNLLEPLFTYLVEKLNPQFNFEKIRQLHSQNISLVDGLPFVCTCEHLKNCVECYNVMLCAVSKNNVKTSHKSTETPREKKTSDTPLRKIEAGLSSITKEIMSLGIPVDENGKSSSKTERKHESKSHSKSSSSSRDRHHSTRHKSKSESKSSKKDSHRHSNEKRSSSHSSSRHKSMKSRDDEKKRRKETSSEEESSSEDEVKRSKHRRSSSADKTRKRSADKTEIESKKPRIESSKSERTHEKKSSKSVPKENSPERVEISDDSDFDNADNALRSDSSPENYSDIEQIGADVEDVAMSSDNEAEETSSKTSTEHGVNLYPSSGSKKRVSHVTEDKILPYNKKQFVKKTIPSPSEVLFQRMQQKEAERAEKAAAEASSLAAASGDRVRISHVPNVALLLQAKERLKNDLLNKAKAPVPVRTSAQTIQKGKSRTAHIATEVPPSKDIPAHVASIKPMINSYKQNNNIPLPTRQNALDRLYGAFAKKVPPELASEMALKEEKTIHEKVTIVKVYLNSLAMALHRISKEDPAKLIEKTSDYPSEINGHSVYDLLSRHVLSREQMEVNGFPIPIKYKSGCCKISTKAVHYKPLTSKRSGDKFFCLQCKEPFEMNPDTGLPVTPTTGCRFHTLRPRKEPGRLRHELFYPCCNKNIAESGCMTAEYHTPDTTDDDCLEGFVETRDPPPGDPGARQFYSLDCEMCYTTVGSELTRVTVIKYDCGVIYDSLVKPRNRILDYCTKFSGITEEKLRHVKKTIEEVRQELLKFIFKDTILIGHSLENDLKALKIQHNKIVDTSVMYPHRDAPERKFSLKYLSSNLVHYLIQESEFGHDSKEDAVACMKLVWKKIREDAQIHRPKKIIGSPDRQKNLISP